MNNIQDKKQLANDFRKQGRIEEALSIYKELYYRNTTDKFDAAGYLHCLRKLLKYEEAMLIAEECEGQYTDFSWCRIEIIWTYIGYLKKKSLTTPLTEFLPIATKIINLNPDDLQKNTTVLVVLKKAKQFKKWNIACEWIDTIDPNTLDKNPIVLEKGTTAWSNYLIWHHHKIRCLIHQHKYPEAIEMVNNILPEGKKVTKYLKTLEAQAYDLMGKPNEAIKILSDICNHRNVDWWVVHQHANLLKKTDEKEQALQMMYKAANLSFKIESIVTLLYDIALLCRELNRIEESYYHIMLCKLVRQKKEWTISNDVEQLIKDTSSNMLNLDTENPKYKEVLHRCQTFWREITTDIDPYQKERMTMKKLKGSLIQVRKDRPFCFIKTLEETFFCYKSEIKAEAKEGLMVQFDVIPSFDKKKKQESLKAVNVVVI